MALFIIKIIDATTYNYKQYNYLKISNELKTGINYSNLFLRILNKL